MKHLRTVITILSLILLVLLSNDMIPSWNKELTIYELKKFIKYDPYSFHTLSYDERLNQLFLTKNDSSLITLNHSSVYVKMPSDFPSYKIKSYFYDESFDHNINFYESTDWYTLGFRLIMIYLFIQVSWIIFSSYFSNDSQSSSLGGIVGNNIKTKGLYQEIKNVKLKFNDVIGMNSVKEDLKLIATIFKNQLIFDRQGVHIPKGLLFTGPPGVGKTLMAKAFSGESKSKFYSISGSDFSSPYIGVGSMIVKDLFDVAKQNKPSVIFIDEIDAIGQKREMTLKHGAEYGSILNKLLEEMDGFSSTEGVIIIAATNRPQTLDRALMRTGRFDRTIAFDLPNITERIELLNLYFNKVMLTPKFKSSLELHIKEFARQSAGMSGSDIKSFINQGVLNYNKSLLFPSTEDTYSETSSESSSDKMELLTNEKLSEVVLEDGTKIIDEQLLKLLNDDDKDDDIIHIKPFIQKARHIEMEKSHFLKAINELRVGIEKKERTMTEKEKKIVSYHEAGHALISYLVEHSKPPIKITIIPHGEGSLGFTMHEPTDKKIYQQSELFSQVAVLLGGITAEKIIFDEIGNGASDDLEKATQLLTNCFSKFGMGNSLVSFDMKNDYIPTKLKMKVIDEVDYALETIHSKVEGILIEQKELLDKIADYLLAHEEIFEENIREILPLELENTFTI